LRFLDTNILLYSISRAREEIAKRDVALALLEERDNALSVQVLQEFYVQATRSTRSDAVPHDIAAGLISAWLRFPVQDITVAVMSGALAIKADFGLSYWDAAIIAAARAIGCEAVISEDMSHGREIAGVVITNPFK
jgi:predicted nucleic acid-binding protein